MTKEELLGIKKAVDKVTKAKTKDSVGTSMSLPSAT